MTTVTGTLSNSRELVPRDIVPSGAELALDAIQRMYDEHLIFPNEESRDAVCLWVLHTHVFRSFTHTPRLSVRSTEPGSGKSRVLEVLHYMVPNGVIASNLTPGTMWRMLERQNPTLLMDEIDTVFGKAGSGTSHVDLRAVINMGHSSYGEVHRCVGSEDVKPFKVFGPIALAGIGRLPDTIASRSVEIVMRKRRKGDPKVQSFELDRSMPELEKIRGMCEAWASDEVKDSLKYAQPKMNAEDRNKDVWKPLIAVADAASESWGKRARAASDYLIAQSEAKPVSLGQQLLADVQKIFGDSERMFSHEIMFDLYAMEDSKWDMRTFNVQKLSIMLKEYGITPKMMRKGREGPARGYAREVFEPSWERVLGDDE